MGNTKMDYFKDKVILLIEDDAGYRELLQNELASVNAIVFSTARGKQATNAFEWHQKIIDCILVGTELPLGVSGFEVYDVHSDRLQRKGVIFMTSDSDRDDRPAPVPMLRPENAPPAPLDILLASEVHGENQSEKRSVSAYELADDITLRIRSA